MIRRLINQHLNPLTPRTNNHKQMIIADFDKKFVPIEFAMELEEALNRKIGCIGCEHNLSNLFDEDNVSHTPWKECKQPCLIINKGHEYLYKPKG